MIILANNPAPNLPDDIQIITEAAFIMGGAGAALTWYCSWNTSQGCSGGPFRNAGIAPVAATAAFTASAPASLISAAFPPTLAPPQLLEVTEITIHNPLTVAGGFGPVSVFVVYYDGANVSSTFIMRCNLYQGNTLSYRATPGNNGTWQIYDGSANVITV
jgi:hypothetical protein